MMMSIHFLIAISVFFCTTLTNPAGKVESQKFDVEIIQNDLPVPISDNTVELEKKEFVIRITLKNHDGVYMSSSFNRDYFDLKEDEPVKDYEYLPLKTRAEGGFNKNRSLIIDDESVSWLFYDEKENWHRFDKDVLINGDTVTGTKTISKFFVSDSKETVEVANVDRDVYLFFLATGPARGRKSPKELGRIKVHIRWK